MRLRLTEAILSDNDAAAAANREAVTQAGITMLNMMGSPGSGKTSVIEQLVSRQDAGGFAVIEGDIATDRDAARVRAAGAPAIQINTDGACHLAAKQVARALSELPLQQLRLVLIENVGNLVCPTSFDLGELGKVVVTSVPEGDEKPEKYPGAFRKACAVVLNKMDLLPHVRFDLGAFRASCRDINPSAPLFEVSCQTGEGIEELLAWMLSLRPATG
jgi:hydrogenase nickel incorporation protein HypB